MPNELPSPDRIQEMMQGFWVSRALFTGVELGVFDQLSHSPASAEVLAYRLRLHPRALERLLNALVALGLLSKEQGRYRNAPEAEAYLVKDRPTYIGGQVEHLASLHWRLWEHLPDAVKNNAPQVRHVLGPGFDILQNLYADPQRLRAFVQGMHNLTMPAAHEIMDNFDCSPFRCLMDVGGGSGALGIAAVKRHPHLKAIVLELPAVCPIAQDYIAQQGVGDRVRVQAGDFFKGETLPREADVIALGWVLHDWPPRQAQAILANCYEALQPGGAILVCEKLLDEDKTGPPITALMNLHALVSTGGEEHTASEYQAWMVEAGFHNMEVRRLTGNRDIVIGWKVR
ncbi:MAG: methyltransferase domain-containing protein [Chloroflexi bacterium]|nr:methyltransferase domain-containing protein [Chloroflexota bacterium]